MSNGGQQSGGRNLLASNWIGQYPWVGVIQVGSGGASGKRPACSRFARFLAFVSVVSRTAWFAQGRMIQCVTTTQNPWSAWLSVPAENASARGSPSRCIRASSRSATARSLDHRSAIVGVEQTIGSRCRIGARCHSCIQRRLADGVSTGDLPVTYCAPASGNDPRTDAASGCDPIAWRSIASACAHRAASGARRRLGQVAGAGDTGRPWQASSEFERQPWLL